MSIKGKILQVQNYSVNDGEGIRTTIFFAGCPLRCQWCANPEGFNTMNRIMYIKSKCTNCYKCVEKCPLNIGVDLNIRSERDKCTGCGKCVPVCLVNARKNTITEYKVSDIIKILEKQLIFFKNSKGGVTYSGGECTQQKVFLETLVNEVYDLGLSQTIETSGYFDLSELKNIFDKLDLIFIDIKHMDRRKHKLYTGVYNDLILNNIKELGQRGYNIIIRVPLIMNINGDYENIYETVKFVKLYVPNPRIEFLPYHEYGEGKYDQLGMVYNNRNFKKPRSLDLEELEVIVKSGGVELVSFK